MYEESFEELGLVPPTGQVTKEQAIKLAANVIERLLGTEHARWSEHVRIAKALAVKAIAETIRNDEDWTKFEKRLFWCVRFVTRLAEAVHPLYVDQAIRKTRDNTPKANPDLVKRWKDIVYRRHSPADAYILDNDRDGFYDCDRTALHTLVGEYINQSWSRHPYVDWILLDAMNTRELCVYGSTLRAQKPKGEKAILALASYSVKSKVNLTKDRMDILFGSLSLLAGIVFGWVIPISAIYFAFAYGYEKTGWAFLILFGLTTAWWLAVNALIWGRRIYLIVTGKPWPETIPVRIWLAMYSVWVLSEGPVINPTHLREKMDEATKLGAVWDQPAWALIDMVVSYDPAAWVITLDDASI